MVDGNFFFFKKKKWSGGLLSEQQWGSYLSVFAWQVGKALCSSEGTIY